MDAVGDQRHKRQLFAGEHPMEDVVVAREQMRAAVAEMGETGKPRGAAFTEQFQRRIAVAAGHEHASAGKERNRAKAGITLWGERHHPHMPAPRVEEPLHRCWARFAGMLRRMGADEAALGPDERPLDMDPGDGVADRRVGCETVGERPDPALEEGKRVSDDRRQEPAATVGPVGPTDPGEALWIEILGAEVEATIAVELEVEGSGHGGRRPAKRGCGGRHAPPGRCAAGRRAAAGESR